MDPRTFEQVVGKHKDRVHGYAALMLRDGSDAQDVAQEAFVRLWSHRDEVDPAIAGVWLLRTSRNLCIDRLRRRTVRAEVSDGPSVIDGLGSEVPDPKRLAGSSETGRVLLRALAGLSEIDRTVVVLREVQGLAYEEIASSLGVPLGTLKARLHRARERLRAQLVRAGVAP